MSVSKHVAHAVLPGALPRKAAGDAGRSQGKTRSVAWRRFLSQVPASISKYEASKARTVSLECFRGRQSVGNSGNYTAASPRG
jgi:hypothetical protein